MGLDIFQEIEIQGHVDDNNDDDENDNEHDNHQQQDGNNNQENEDDPETTTAANNNQHHNTFLALDAFGFRMKFSRRLRKLELIHIPITKDHIESLMYGIETSSSSSISVGCQLHTLSFEEVVFVNNHDDDDDDETNTESTGSGGVDEIIQELCEGIPNNTTLHTLELQRCQLMDHHIAMVVRSITKHQTIKTLNVSENHCRQQGLLALNELFSLHNNNNDSNNAESSSSEVEHPEEKKTSSTSSLASRCKLETLDLSYQFTSEDTFATGERIQLELLLCPSPPTQHFSQYPYLRTLILSGNQIQDPDMETLAILIRRFPQLQEIDLRFNDISTEGLQLFADCSDPNNNERQQSHQSHPHYSIPYVSRIQTIRLTNNPLTNDASEIVLELFKLYPQLQFVQSNVEWENSIHAKPIQHLMDINRAGRVLLVRTGNNQRKQHQQDYGNIQSTTTIAIEGEKQQQHQHQGPIALSVWPYVLSRLTRKRRYPNVIPTKNGVNGIYYLIRHGPIFMQKIAKYVPPTTVSRNNGDKKVDNGKDDDDDSDDDDGRTTV